MRNNKIEENLYKLPKIPLKTKPIINKKKNNGLKTGSKMEPKKIGSSLDLLTTKLFLNRKRNYTVQVNYNWKI